MAARSPNYPSIGLSKAVEAIKILWTKEGKSPFPPVQVVATGGYTTLSGSSRSYLASIRQYGFLEDVSGREFFKLSPLAMKIVAHEAESDEYQAALREAALTPKLFREIFQTYRDASDGSIKAFLITKKSFSDEGAKAAIRAFRDTIQTAGLDQPGLNPFENDANLDGGGAIIEKLDTQMDSGAKIRQAMTLPAGRIFSVNVEMFESGKLNVVFAGVSSRTTMSFLNEIYQLCDKYDPQPAEGSIPVKQPAQLPEGADDQ